MSVISGAATYGLTLPAPTTSQPTAVATPSTPSAITTGTESAAKPNGWHQDPVLILVGLVAIAFLLARGAEHGLSFGFSTKVRAR